MNKTTNRGKRTARCFLTALLLAPLAAPLYFQPLKLTKK
jgi:hypothetical protein